MALFVTDPGMKAVYRRLSLTAPLLAALSQGGIGTQSCRKFRTSPAVSCAKERSSIRFWEARNPLQQLPSKYAFQGRMRGVSRLTVWAKGNASQPREAPHLGESCGFYFFVFLTFQILSLESSHGFALNEITIGNLFTRESWFWDSVISYRTFASSWRMKIRFMFLGYTFFVVIFLKSISSRYGLRHSL